MVTLAFAIFLVLHGLLHLLGFAKAFGIAALPELTQRISPTLGLVWLVAAALFCTTAVATFVWPRVWWAIGACAIVVSMCAILPSWRDAKFGALANLVAGVGVVFGFLAQGPTSLRAQHDRDGVQRVARVRSPQIIGDADLATLPRPIQKYLRVVGVVGHPRVHNFRVRMHGRIRNGPNARWMPIRAEQYSFVDDPARLFYIEASMLSLPVQGYHRYVDSSAAMRIKAGALVPVVDVSGDEMLQGETVTMFNDMCVMAPATLISPAIVWETVDDRTVRARFTNVGRTIRAELSFNDAGELIDFWSDDRYQTAPDGKTMRKLRWSTPVGGYRSFGRVRLAATGEARWHEPDGAYAYIELELDAVDYNVQPR